MTLTIDYELSHHFSEPTYGSPADVRPSDLRMTLLCGDIFIRSGSDELTTAWGWVPVLGFAASLQRVSRELLSASAAEILFTENDERVTFVRQDNGLLIGATFTSASVQCAFTEFASGAADMSRRVVADLKAVNPIAAASPALVDLEARMFAH